MATIQILDRDTLSEKKYPLQFVRFQKPDRQGKLHEQENEVYFRPDAATVLLVDEKAKTFLLTRQFRLPAFLNGSDSGYLTESCAGLINEGETPEEAVRREAGEETGYNVTDLHKIAAVYTSAGGITEYIHLFTGSIDLAGNHERGGGLAEEGEDIELVYLSFDEARQQLSSGAIRDAKTLVLLQHYFLNYDQ